MVEENNLGGGIDLDKNWDIQIDNTGDVKTVFGVDEVKKDLAYNIAENLQPILGESKNRSTEEEVIIITRETIDSYANVDELLSIDVEFGRWNDEYDVKSELEVSINDEPKDLVVTV